MSQSDEPEPAGESNRAVPDFSYVYVQWREENDFKSIAEYFSGKEYAGGDLILRSDPSVRSGLYFRIGVSWGTNVPKLSTATLEYINSDSPGILTRDYVLSEYPTNPLSEAKLGLTGKDWPKKKTSLVAWRLTFRDPGGAIIAQRQSFLWGMPAEKTGEK